MQDCSLNGIAFIQIAPPFLILSELTLCPNLPQSTIYSVTKHFQQKIFCFQSTPLWPAPLLIGLSLVPGALRSDSWEFYGT